MMLTVVNNNQAVNTYRMTGILKISCGIQKLVNDMALDSYNNQPLSQHSLKVTEGLINKLKHEICLLKKQK